MKIEVEVPEGEYCAKTDRDGVVYHPICHLLHHCGKTSFYCAITNRDMYLPKDVEGVRKWNHPPYICPSLKETRRQIRLVPLREVEY